MEMVKVALYALTRLKSECGDMIEEGAFVKCKIFKVYGPFAGT